MNTEDKFEEQVAVGGPLIDSRVLDDVLKEAAPEDFYQPAHETILEAMKVMSHEGRPIDAVTVGDHLERTGQLHRVGGRVYLHECAQSVPVPMNAPYYAQIVRDKAHRRSVHATGHRLAQMAETGGDMTEVISGARHHVDSLSALRQGGVRPSLAKIAAEAMDDLDRPVNQPTPWSELNAVIGGWTPGRLYVMGARPGVGKTSGMTTAAIHSARLNRGTVVMFSLEMSDGEIMQRMAVSVSNVNSALLLHGNEMTDHTKQRLREGMNKVAQMDMVIEDGLAREVTVEDIRSTIREISARTNIGLVCVDFLQEIKGPHEKGRAIDEHLRIGRNAQSLKHIAAEFNVPILALAAVRRYDAGQTERMPQITDLKGSSGIESAADVALMMHRVMNENDPAHDPKRMEVWVAKNRQGPQPTIELNYDGRFFRLENWKSLYDQRLEGEA